MFTEIRKLKMMYQESHQVDSSNERILLAISNLALALFSTADLFVRNALDLVVPSPLGAPAGDVDTE